MLFHITHHHDENTCPAHDQEAADATFGAVLESLEANVDQVMGAWVDPPVHDFFFVIEADDSKKIFAGLWPIIQAGTAQISPVTSLKEVIETSESLRS